MFLRPNDLKSWVVVENSLAELWRVQWHHLTTPKIQFLRRCQILCEKCEKVRNLEEGSKCGEIWFLWDEKCNKKCGI